MAFIYTLVNQKGGVGKTTTAINLGAYLGLAGQRVLLIDMDPQANATASLGIPKSTVKAGTYDALLRGIQARELILHSAALRMSLLPSSLALAGAEVELVDLPDRAQRLRNVIRDSADNYDYILVDCPPSLGLLTLNALVAAEGGVLIPVQCEYLALEGLGQLTDTITRVRSSLYPGLRIRGVILTMYDGRTRLANDVVSDVRRFFPQQVFQTVIPRSVRLAEAPSYGKPIPLYAPDSISARAYESLANEILIQDGRPVVPAY